MTLADNKGGDILFILTDQHRTDTLGLYGNAYNTSPNLDALAAEATVFDNAFTPTAICTPARATLLTGRLPFRHKLLANHERNVGYAEDLGDDQVPFTAQLRGRGYRCGLVGKWHVGYRKGPNAFGFEGTHFPGWHNPVHHPEYESWLSERGLPGYRLLTEVRGRFPNGQPGNLLAGILDQPPEATFEHFLADQAIAALRRYTQGATKGRPPFFLALHFFGPHLPYLLPEVFYTRFDPAQVVLPRSMLETFEGKPAVQRSYSAHWSFDDFSSEQWQGLIAAYWGYVALIDMEIGRVFDEARDLGIWDSLTVIFSADHGEFTGSHRLNDKGPAMYDDIYRIPLVVRVPHIEAARNATFVSLTDLTPTFCELAGAEVQPGYDGRSLLPLIGSVDNDGRPTEVIAEFHGHHFPYPQRMLRTERWKLVVNPAGVNELYDLLLDPAELLNRYHHPELAQLRSDLERRLYEVLRERGDNFYHWMTSMSGVGKLTYDPTLGSFGQPTGAIMEEK